MSTDDPKGPAAQMQRRLAQLAQEWARGRVSLRQIMDLDDNELYVLANQGYTLFMQGKTEDARIIFEGLITLDPKNAYFYKALGSIYWRLGHSQKALRQFTYAIRVDPHDIANYINRAEVHVAAKDFAYARQDLEQALDRAQPQDTPLMRKAKAILKMIPRGALPQKTDSSTQTRPKGQAEPDATTPPNDASTSR